MTSTSRVPNVSSAWVSPLKVLRWIKSTQGATRNLKCCSWAGTEKWGWGTQVRSPWEPWSAVILSRFVTGQGPIGVVTMHCWARYLFLAVVMALGAGQVLTACGQKGDLYLVKEGDAASKAQPSRQPRPSTAVPPDYAPQGDGESLNILDAVPTTTPDLGGF